MADSQALTSARVRRDELYDAILAVERALAAPASGHPVSWSKRVRDDLGELRTAFENHIAVTEGSGGLFEEIMSREPRLAHAIERLRVEHRPLLETFETAGAHLGSVEDEAGVGEIRDTVLALVHDLFVHRHRGAELLYEAYNVDVSAGD